MRTKVPNIIPTTVGIFTFVFFWKNFTTLVNAQVINEISPTSQTEWVEFHNASASAEYIKSYYIDDDQSFTEESGKEKQLLTNLNTSNVTFPYIEVSSFFNNDGDWVVLFSPDGTKLDEYHYEKDPGDVTIGRNPDRTGNFYTLSSATKGSSNAQPISSPAVNPTPQSSPTYSPTPKPSSYASPKATVKPTRKPTPIPSKKPSPQPSSATLGEATASPLENPASPSAAGSHNVSAGLLFIAGGLLFSGSAGFIIYKKMGQKVSGTNVKL